NIEKARLPHDSLAPSAHGPLPSASQIRSDLARRIFRGAHNSVMLWGTVRSPQRWLGAPSRTSRMSRRANLRASTSRKTWKHAVFEVGMIKYTQVPSLGETAPYK